MASASATVAFSSTSNVAALSQDGAPGVLAEASEAVDTQRRSPRAPPVLFQAALALQRGLVDFAVVGGLAVDSVAGAAEVDSAGLAGLAIADFEEEVVAGFVDKQVWDISPTVMELARPRELQAGPAVHAVMDTAVAVAVAEGDTVGPLVTMTATVRGTTKIGLAEVGAIGNRLALEGNLETGTVTATEIGIGTEESGKVGTAAEMNTGNVRTTGISMSRGASGDIDDRAKAIHHRSTPNATSKSNRLCHTFTINFGFRHPFGAAFLSLRPAIR